jgi:Mn2+/Fe2+ NRAMP family transporter
MRALRARRAAGLVALAAVVGPGLLAGLSDDDAPGITTYSILGADYGYRLLWVLLLSTVALVLFHEIGARLGVVTGQGLAGLIRERYGVRWAAVSLLALLIANVGTTCAEFAGVAAAMELAGVSRVLSVPVAALAVSLLVLRGSFRRIERLLLALSTVFVAYIASGLLAGPDWGATAGTTLAPWGLAFIQSYAVDKRLKPEDLRYERIDVITGAVLTGVIGLFVVIACAATLHVDHRSINDARDAAVALDPLAGGLASTLFGGGLLGASLLAASILPLSTAYSVSEALGDECALDDAFADAPVFYITYGFVVVVSAGFVLVPSAPLVPILFLSQVLNAVLLLPLLVFVHRIARDPEVMGEHANGRVASLVVVTAIALIALCVASLGVLSVI